MPKLVPGGKTIATIGPKDLEFLVEIDTGRSALDLSPLAKTVNTPYSREMR